MFAEDLSGRKFTHRLYPKYFQHGPLSEPSSMMIHSVGYGTERTINKQTCYMEIVASKTVLFYHLTSLFGLITKSVLPNTMTTSPHKLIESLKYD